MKKKDIKVKFIWKAKPIYEGLRKSISSEDKQGIKNSFKRQLLNSIHHQLKKIELRFPIGKKVSKNLIPKKLKRFGLKTLYYSKLTQGWRMLYSMIRGNKKNEVICIVAIISNHKEYDKLMNY